MWITALSIKHRLWRMWRFPMKDWSNLLDNIVDFPLVILVIKVLIPYGCTNRPCKAGNRHPLIHHAWKVRYIWPLLFQSIINWSTTFRAILNTHATGVLLVLSFAALAELIVISVHLIRDHSSLRRKYFLPLFRNLSGIAKMWSTVVSYFLFFILLTIRLENDLWLRNNLRSLNLISRLNCNFFFTYHVSILVWLLKFNYIIIWSKLLHVTSW